MKHPILTVAFLVLSLLGFSQGVTFEQGSWSDALALAKQTNKPVLLYVYFSDDDESRKIDEMWNTFFFSRKTEGDVFNANFVCYRMDASKKEGLEMAQQYGLTKRPALLFVNSDGMLLSIIGSQWVPDAFKEKARKVLLDLKDPKPMTAWEAEFPQKKNDPAFLLEFINKRIDLGLPINEAFDAYLRLIPATGPIPEQVAKLFQMNAYRLMVTDYAYSYFFTNRKAYDKTIATINGRAPYEDNRIFQKVVEHTVDVAALAKDEALLKKAITVFQQIPFDSENKQVEEVYMDYYLQTNQPDNYLAHARLFVADNLMKLDSEELLMKNNTRLLNLEKRKASVTDTASVNSIDRAIKGLPAEERSRLCGKITTVAGYVCTAFSDATMLKEALSWSDKTVQCSPKTSFFLSTNAHLLYKLGRKEEAIAMEKRAVANFQGSPTYTRFTDTLKKMEAGEKFW